MFNPLISRVAAAQLFAFAGTGALFFLAAIFWFLRQQALKNGRHHVARGLALSMALTLTPIGLGAGLYLEMTHLEPNWLQVSRVTIHSPRLAPSLQGLRIIQISDLHVMDKVPGRVRRTIQKVNALKPDVIVITGDFVSKRGAMEKCLAALDKLRRPPLGLWAIPGNTDEIFYSQSELASLCQAHGITMLINERRRLTWGDRPAFCLAGVDDPTYGKDNLPATLEGLPLDVPVFLLAHSPSNRIVAQASQRRVALLVVGHTHGGQVGIPWLRQLSAYANRTPYMSGLYQIDQMNLYVNRGIGTKTREIRLMCRPEITVFEVVP